MSETGRVPSPAAQPAVAAAAPEEKKGKEPEREKLPPIVSAGAGAAAGLDRGAKGQISTFSSFVSTVSQKKEAPENRSSPTHLVFPNIKNVRDLPPICLDVRQKQRLSLDALPSEMKAPALPEPTLPIQSKTMKDFQEDIEKVKSSGDWKAVHDFYLTTFDSFPQLNAAFKKDATAPFNSIEDSGINAKFVNAVYDALLNTVSYPSHGTIMSLPVFVEERHRTLRCSFVCSALPGFAAGSSRVGYRPFHGGKGSPWPLSPLPRGSGTPPASSLGGCTGVPLRCSWCMPSLSSFIVLLCQSQLSCPHAKYAALLQSGASPTVYWLNWRQLCRSCFLLSQRHIVGEQMHRISLNSSNLV
ncbi:probable E3 ubiquitin-protein ligase HECTD2 isoform X6 [Oryctolagus cuniculus]|uniref:probable E3 ubiquitin-protein ligase HECTD2 isoform X6 n=1 Tax=Oryctolagus cuniculus TaxID=9986 RepID=UPI003879C31A